MTGALPRPGPDANRAFRHGIVAACVLALAALGALYWAGALDLVHVGFAVAVGGPVYLVLAASALSVWLGFDKDATDLQPVTGERDDSSDSGPGRRPQS